MKPNRKYFHGLLLRAGAVVSCALVALAAGAASVAIEDFEADLALAPTAANGWEFKGGEHSSATMNVNGADPKRGKGAGEVVFNVKPGSWALVQKKIEGAEWLKGGPKAISFWVKGGGTGEMTVELEESYTYKWQKKVPLSDTNWHFVKIKFSEFACPDKAAMSPPDLVVLKFVFFGGTSKVLLDDIQVEFEE